jgi:hypothetical protein
MVSVTWDHVDGGTIEMYLNGESIGRYPASYATTRHLIDGPTMGLALVLEYLANQLEMQNKRIAALENHPAMQAWKYG